MKMELRTDAGLSRLAEHYGIRLILQFGSTVSGPTHAESDMDVAILMREASPSLRTLAEIRQALQEHFTGREVDLSVINRADPLFLKKVIERCVQLYGSIHDLHELKIYAFKRYQDHRRFLDMEKRYVEHSIASYLERTG